VFFFLCISVITCILLFYSLGVHFSIYLISLLYSHLFRSHYYFCFLNFHLFNLRLLFILCFLSSFLSVVQFPYFFQSFLRYLLLLSSYNVFQFFKSFISSMNFHTFPIPRFRFEISNEFSVPMLF
jgi:hypothetical protein